MDELGRVIANLMNSLPENGTGGADASPPPEGTSVPFPAAPSSPGSSAGEASDGGGSAGELAALLPGMGGGMPSDNRKMQLLLALKPYLRPERCERIDRLCRLVDMAYGVRGALRSLGGIFHV